MPGRPGEQFLVASGVIVVSPGWLSGDVQHRNARPPTRGSAYTVASAATRNPMFPVELSGVFAVRAATRYRLQYDLWQR